MRHVLPAVLTVLALASSGCVMTRSSAVPSSAAAGLAPQALDAVQVRATTVPEGARELGLVEANGLGAAELPDIVAEFRQRVAVLGGNYAKVDRIASKFEMQTQMYTYTCGKSTCTGTRQVEVRTTSVLGRAFLIEKSTTPRSTP
jgi:hypothetical protein